ncbi:MAG TPA: surface-adhesin E family protein [Vitreimonas sp.]|uniref:surface-adhesin E family protein n=1 Tax=Vitreimonas sp. TaxID=3069702 RepID=UPI002D3AFF09|nr:surface-adhesin E family protein [Vitreimonas sp.]HYD89784.1 surface-adhesin E family protein [Vitreimonas sp.]
MRKLAALFAIFTLAACGQPQQQAPAPQGQAEAPGETDSVILGSTQNLPDWLLVARQRDCRGETPAEDRACMGEVHFNQRTITRSADGATADIWIQVRHGQPQRYDIEDATSETTIRYTTQRLHYRFNCAEQQFMVVERQIMGAGETVVARDEPAQRYRAPVAGSITAIVMPIACRGG